MNKKEIESSFLLLLASAIWGFAFVAQRVSIDYIGAFTYNGIRFALGSISMLPLVFLSGKVSGRAGETEAAGNPAERKKFPVAAAGLIAGSVLFFGASFQQLGLYTTTAGKAGFITDLYIVMVPLAGVFFKQHLKAITWAGVALAAVGLYFICVTERFTIVQGDLFELAGTLFWTVHIYLISYFSKRMNPLALSMAQYAVCSALSLAVALFTETITLQNIILAAVPILYGGICSVGVAYTLQAIGQRHARPTHAAIIMSMESVFACLGGTLVLHENMGARSYAGCVLMVAGMVATQLDGLIKFKKSYT